MGREGAWRQGVSQEAVSVQPGYGRVRVLVLGFVPGAWGGGAGGRVRLGERGELWGPLHGVRVTIEDIHATAWMRSTFGGYRPFAGSRSAWPGDRCARWCA